jgi:hypothetical protein
MKKVYIASPYTKGDVALNVKRQMDVASRLMDLGFAPFWPLHSHFLHMAHPREWDQWINIDLQWILSCDALLRLDGESRGADIEAQFAKQNRIPVYYDMQELINGLRRIS